MPSKRQLRSGSRPAVRWARAAAVGLAAAAILTPRAGGAWMLDTHRQIAAVAVDRLPAGMRQRLAGSLPDLLEGTVRPDLIPADGVHHSWCPDAPCGDAPDQIAAEFSALLRDFRPLGWPGRLLAGLTALSPAGCAPYRPPAGPNPEAGLAFRLGVLAHYVADVSVPYHTLPYEGDAKRRHLEFERAVDAGRAGLGFSFDGRFDDVAADPRGFALAIARASREDLAIVDDPAIDRGSPAYRAAVQRSYSRAVDAVLDAWHSVLVRLADPD